MQEPNKQEFSRIVDSSALTMDWKQMQFKTTLSIIS